MLISHGIAVRLTHDDMGALTELIPNGIVVRMIFFGGGVLISILLVR